MKLSKHFTLAELTVTTTGLPNQPVATEIVERLRQVCIQILEPVRDHFGKAVIVHSGYRSPAVNKAVKGSATSQHCKGEAADFHVAGVSVFDLADWLSGSDIGYDQLILENFVPGSTSSGWVHCSYSKRNRNMDLTKFKGSSKYHPGILLKS
jgi:hypothetical protein